jgi:hypothetical protein
MSGDFEQPNEERREREDSPAQQPPEAVERAPRGAAPIVPIETFYPVGIRLNGRSETPDLYTFLFEQGGETRPLLHEGQVVLFTHLSLAETALNAAGIVARFRSLSLENVYLIDVAHTLFLLARESVDPQKRIANTLDLFARILTGLGIGVPPVYADILIDLGNHVDSDPFYGEFMAAEEFRRERAIDAVRWCLGTILSVTKLIKGAEDR